MDFDPDSGYLTKHYYFGMSGAPNQRPPGAGLRNAPAGALYGAGENGGKATADARPQALTGVRALAAVHEPRDGGHQFVREFLGLTLGVPADDAVASVRVEQSERHLVQCVNHQRGQFSAGSSLHDARDADRRHWRTADVGGRLRGDQAAECPNKCSGGAVLAGLGTRSQLDFIRAHATRPSSRPRSQRS